MSHLGRSRFAFAVLTIVALALWILSRRRQGTMAWRESEPASPNKRRMALLVDCDNQSWRHIGDVIAAARSSGLMIERRAYGNWMNPVLSPWIAVCARYGIKQVHVPAKAANNKNATDLALAIDAIELCLSGEVDAVCIVSGDSDFLPLVRRLHDHGIYVVGASWGGAGTSRVFEQACDRFIARPANGVDGDQPISRDGSADEDQVAAASSWDRLALLALRSLKPDAEGWVSLSTVGAEMRRREPHFDPKSHGAPGLRALIATRDDLFEIEDRLPEALGASPLPWIRDTQLDEPLDHRKI